MEASKRRNWWCMLWPADEATALAWQPTDKPKLKYCCWRVHKCPTTQRVHIHILFQFTTVVRYETLVNKGFNNIKWVEGQENLEKKRGYCIDDNHKKDGTPKGVISEFREVGQFNISANKKNKRDEYYTQAFRCENTKESMRIIIDNCPRDYALYGSAIERNIRTMKKPRTEIRFHLEDFNLPEIDFEEKAILIWGPTGTGKTQFAKAHFTNPLVVRHIDELNNLHDEHDGIVFDDMSFTNRPPNTIIHLLDWDEVSQIHCRYKNAVIPAHTRKIFTYNDENPFYERFQVSSEQMEAIERRLKRVNVTEKLY